MRSALDDARYELGLSTGGYTDSGLAAGYLIRHEHIQELRDRVREALNTSSSSDQFVQNFLQSGLGRTPNGDEASYWRDIIRAAYQQGQGSMLLAITEFGMTVFESAEYAGRNRTNSQYVSDLYHAYLMRAPEPCNPNDPNCGPNYWANACDTIGREAVRNAFEDATEFRNIVATLTASGAPTSNAASLATARVDLFNQSGNQIEARDCEWSVPLLSLPGRAGLDLGLSLSYSSLVWTRSGPYLYFDPDIESLSPGFTIGFPTVQGRRFDAQTRRNVYLLTAAGHRTELRQVNTSNVYEAADSSYLQLIDYGSSLLLRTTDGTQMSLSPYLNNWCVMQIKDRNGNLINIVNDWRGDIQNITDTLGRTIYFNYDGNANLLSITQSWSGQPQPHTWASFVWSNLSMSPAFSGVVGTHNGEIIPVVTQVGLDDGSRYTFDYNGNGQVNLIQRYAAAADQSPRSSMTYVYNGATDDCPRLTAARVSAENWTSINNLPAYIETQYGPEGAAHVLTAPDGTIYKEFYGTGWQKGLITQTEVWGKKDPDHSLSLQKWTTTQWTRDNTEDTYQTNPRVIQTDINDAAGKHRRTTIDYGQYAQWGLPYLVKEGDGATELRQTYTDYNLSQAYLDRRIIGLVSTVRVYDPVTAQWEAKITYGYDDPARLQSQATTAPGHDQSYDNSFTIRGNLTGVARWDVTDINNAGKALTSNLSYDAAGSVIETIDALSHRNSISYSDSFAGTYGGANTFAYPTMVKDADWNASTAPNNYSTFQYNYNFGARTQVQGPPPQNQSSGMVQTFTYDDARRVKRATVVNTGAYTHYEYGPNYTQAYASVNTVSADPYSSDSYSMQVFDGLGRVFAAESNNPGSAGGYKAQWTQFDAMGRVMKQSNPTEISSNGTPSGDDAAGAVYTQQTYDWKGRPLETINTADGTIKFVTYDGCGCAGGEVVTLTDEMGREQKVYHDVLGRVAKTEILQTINNVTSVYASTANSYNARDQVTLARQFQGNDQSSVYQDTTMSYDGYGRLQTKHVPEQQDSNGNPTHTTWAYNPDDTLLTITDARGATCTYGYNGRHLVTSATHAWSGQPTIALSYGYDAAGNRISMGDPQGSSTYAYDSLSRMTSETRYFSALANSPTAGNYNLTYQYNLANELTSITDPFSAQIGYTRDVSGRVTNVTGSGFLNISTYASNIQYRAWGAQKSVTYGDGTSATTSYNSLMQPSSYQLPGLREQFQYYADGRLQQMTDLDDRGQDIGYPDTARHFSRVHSYDQVGRLVSATGTPSQVSSLPYNQSYGYNEFGNATSRYDAYYYQNPSSDGGGFQNNRRQDFGYDADGNVTHAPSYNYAGGSVVSFRDWTYDAAGQMTQVKETITANSSVSTYISSHDGDGQPIVEYFQENSATKSFMVRSSVLGGKVLTRLNNAGNKSSTVFSVDGLLTAVQDVYSGVSSVRWTHIDPLGLSEAGDTKSVYDPMGNYIVWQHAPVGPPPNAYPPIAASFGGLGPSFGYAINSSCILDGIPTDCSLALNMLEHGSAEQCPNNYCGAGRARNGDLRPLTRDPDTGLLGYYSIPLQNSGLDQHGRSAQFIKCANDAGLGWLLKEDAWKRGHTFNDENARFVNEVAAKEGIDPGLLGFTFDNEGLFNKMALGNDNSSADQNDWDIGPFGLNYTWVTRELDAGSYNANGINLAKAFGGANLFVLHSLSDTTQFIDPTENGRLAARKLAYQLKTSGNDYAKAAGRYRAYKGAEFTGRRDLWNLHGKQFQDFLKCFNER